MNIWRFGSRWNWRISPHFCIRFLPGLWLPFIIVRRDQKYWGFALPGMAVAFDYESERPMVEEIDLQGCEHCSKEFPIEDMMRMEDIWICAGCYDAWHAEFKACEHEWRPRLDEFGEPGHICDRCSGFVLDEDFSSQGLTLHNPAATTAAT